MTRKPALLTAVQRSTDCGIAVHAHPPSEFNPMLRVMVHDEIVMSVPVRDLEEVGREVRKAFTFEWPASQVAHAVPEGEETRAGAKACERTKSASAEIIAVQERRGSGYRCLRWRRLLRCRRCQEP